MHAYGTVHHLDVDLMFILCTFLKNIFLSKNSMVKWYIIFIIDIIKVVHTIIYSTTLSHLYFFFVSIKDK